MFRAPVSNIGGAAAVMVAPAVDMAIAMRAESRATVAGSVTGFWNHPDATASTVDDPNGDLEPAKPDFDACSSEPSRGRAP